MLGCGDVDNDCDILLAPASEDDLAHTGGNIAGAATSVDEHCGAVGGVVDFRPGVICDRKNIFHIAGAYAGCCGI